MIQQTSDVSLSQIQQYDAVIDVRSPSEYAEDHLPGAINLPVLDDEERAEVGTTYVQTSRFLARRIGAAKVARNVARHLETALADKPTDFHPLIYCWRGGQRSNAMATILSQVGWRISLLSGGYRTWRRAVVDSLANEAVFSSVILLDGQAGAGKSVLLDILKTQGAQVLDLERAANHRGSIFGGYGEGSPQPSQKLFETHLHTALSGFDPSKPLYVEAESSLIGTLHVPQALWRAMRSAKRIQIDTPLTVRTRHILEVYQDMRVAPDRVLTLLEHLRPYQSKSVIEAWLSYAQAGDYRPLVAELLAVHYDPLYSKGRRARKDQPAASISLDGMGADALQAAASAIMSVSDEVFQEE